MSIQKQQIKDSIAILGFIAISCYLLYLNACNERKEVKAIRTDITKDLVQIAKANKIIDSLMLRIDSLEKVKQPIIKNIVKRNGYINKVKDSVRVLIKDTTVLAYVDTLEKQNKDCIQAIEIQEEALSTKDLVIAKKDTIIAYKDNVIEAQELDIENLEKDNKKKDRKIKILKFERVLYPAVAIIGGIYLSLRL